MSLVENIRQLQPGQKLWFVRNSDLSAHWLVIEKVGRKWVTIEGREGWRVDASGRVERQGSSLSVGQCYLTQEEGDVASESERVRDMARLAWQAFRRKFSNLYVLPHNVTAENIREAAKLLGFEGEL